MKIHRRFPVAGVIAALACLVGCITEDFPDSNTYELDSYSLDSGRADVSGAGLDSDVSIDAGSDTADTHLPTCQSVQECPSDSETHLARTCTDATCGFDNTTCASGFVDVNENQDDGCECEITNANDVPDATGEDTNCDGVDGILDGADANVVFVDAEGNSGGDGLSAQRPLKSLQSAIDKAASEQRAFVLVAGGTYTEQIELKDGVSIYGRYSPDHHWSRDGSSQETIIEPDLADFGPGTEHFKSVIADGLNAVVILDHVSINGVNAVSPGASTYALWAKDTADLTVRHSVIVAGTGGVGADGNDGIDGSARLANGACTPLSGGTEGEADSGEKPCQNSGVDGDHATQGGAGGGADASQNSGLGGLGGTHHCNIAGDSSGGGSDGEPGLEGTDGTDGAAGKFPASFSAHFDSNGHWRTSLATPPERGTNGGGGGGGGAGGNYEMQQGDSPSRAGGGGGHGGNGGCAGTAATNGQAGGGSFGIAMIGGQITVTDTKIVMGDGADGGKGGKGGHGDDLNLSDGKTSKKNGMNKAGDGGPGGFGGPGGNGGSGAGGAGGPTIGIALADSATLTNTSNLTFDAARAGEGGDGGTITNAGPEGIYAEQDAF
jgi:hypothetical protein